MLQLAELSLLYSAHSCALCTSMQIICELFRGYIVTFGNLESNRLSVTQEKRRAKNTTHISTYVRARAQGLLS